MTGVGGFDMAEVYRRCRGDIFGYILRRTGDLDLSADLTSETFARALKARVSYRDQGVPVRAWLFTIARNLVSDHQRSAYARMTVLSEDGAPDGVDAEHPEGQVILRESAGELVEAMCGLTPVQRQCLFLRFYADRSVAETAEFMDKNPLSVRAIQYRATSRLRETVRQLHPYRPAGASTNSRSRPRSPKPRGSCSPTMSMTPAPLPQPTVS